LAVNAADGPGFDGALGAAGIFSIFLGGADGLDVNPPPPFSPLSGL